MLLFLNRSEFPQRGKSNLSQNFHRECIERFMLTHRRSTMRNDSEKKKRGRQTSRKMDSQIIHGKLTPRLQSCAIGSSAHRDQVYHCAIVYDFFESTIKAN